MRERPPVTGIERPLADGQILVSRTDLRGVITMVNEAFVEVSGYDRDELIGKPHNLVRHPDMPRAAFADLWRTIRSGQSWVGLVKNRCKNGDHYWVRANVTPEIAEGRLSGYISVRIRPEAAEVAKAEEAYRRINDGDRSLVAVRGRLRRTGWRDLLDRASATMQAQVAAGFIVVLALSLAGAVIGLKGITDAVASTRSLYQDRLLPVVQVDTVVRMARETNADLASAATEADPRPAGERLAVRRTEAARQLDAFLRTGMTSAEEPLARRLSEAYAAWDAHVQVPALATLAQGRSDTVRERLAASADQLTTIIAASDELKLLHERAGRALLEGQNADLRLHVLLTGASLGLAALLSIALAIGLPLRLNRRLHRVNHCLDEIARGHWDRALELDARDDFQSVFLGLTVLQTKLAYAELVHNEQRRALAADFDRQVGGVLGTLRQSVQRLQGTAGRQNAVAGEVATEARHLSAATSQLTDSIRSIADQAGQVTGLAHQVSTAAERSRATIDRLVSAAGEITDVARLIDRIAEQTSLLALNASIEASNAGEAGRSFAVVANEVKGLSGRTREATSTINERIDAIQADTRAAVDALDALAAEIRHLNESAQTISAAVAEQSSATAGIAGNAERTTAGAADTDAAARAVAEAGQALAVCTTALDRALDRFKACM